MWDTLDALGVSSVSLCVQRLQPLLYSCSGAPQQPCSQSQRSASMAAMAPVPADVIACL